MTNQMLNIVAVLEDEKLAVAQDRKTLRIQYTENTVNVLKQYIEQVYKVDFDSQQYFEIFTSTLYSISNHIRESFYYHETHSVFNSIEIEDDYYIELAKLFNLINDIRMCMLNDRLSVVYFYVGSKYVFRL